MNKLEVSRKSLELARTFAADRGHSAGGTLWAEAFLEYLGIGIIRHEYVVYAIQHKESGNVSCCTFDDFEEAQEELSEMTEPCKWRIVFKRVNEWESL